MKKISSVITNAILYTGIVILLLVIIFAIIINQQEHHAVFDFLPAIVCLSGIPVFILSIKYTKRAYHLFTGMALFTWGLMFFLIMKGFVRYRFAQLWPVIGITAGLFIFIAGLTKYKKLKFGYFIPALSLFLMGIWFMLFSLNIIKVPFKTVAIIGGPLFMILVCIFIIGFFMLQQKYSNLILKDDDSEFDDDELLMSGDKNGD